MNKLDDAKIYQQSLNEIKQIRNKIDNANIKKYELSKKIDNLSEQIREINDKKEMLLPEGDISKISGIKKLTKHLDVLLQEKYLLTDIYDKFISASLMEIKQNLDTLTANGRAERSKEYLSIQNASANELKAIYTELEIEMNAALHSALIYPHIA